MTKEALKLALEALEYRGVGSWRKKQPAITAIKQALAQPEHGWTPEQLAGIARLKEAQDKKLSQRTWVGLTADEMRSLLHLATYMDVTDHIHMLMMAEDKLKEKNT